MNSFTLSTRKIIFAFLTLFLICSCNNGAKIDHSNFQCTLDFILNDVPADYALIQKTNPSGISKNGKDTLLFNSNREGYTLYLDEPGYIIISLGSFKDLTHSQLNKLRWIYVDTTSISIVHNNDKDPDIIASKNHKIGELVSLTQVDNAKKFNQLQKKINELAGSDIDNNKLLLKRRDSLYQRYSEIWGEACEKYIDETISLYFLQKYYNWVRDKYPKEVKRLYEKLPSELKKLSAAKSLENDLEVSLKTGIGAKIPKIQLPNSDNEFVELDLSNHKYTLIDFWAAWCAPCRKEHPNLVTVYNEYNNIGFSIVSVSIDKESDKDNWLNAISMDSLVWLNLWDYELLDTEAKTGIHNVTASKFGVKGVPTNFLVNNEGIIVAKNLRGEELNKTLKRFFE